MAFNDINNQSNPIVSTVLHFTPYIYAVPEVQAAIIAIVEPYLQGITTGIITETDPIFTASAAFGISSTSIGYWNSAYNDKIVSAAFTGTSTKTLTLTQQDGGTITANFTDLQGVTSVNGNSGPSVTLTADNIPDGSVNHYYTIGQAQTDLLVSIISNGDSTHAPNADAVYDALALKLDNTYVVGGSSGIITAGTIITTVSQSGTAGYSVLDFNVTESSIGAGAGYFTRYRKGGSDILRLRSTGLIEGAGISNITSSNNALLNLTSAGATISRNVADGQTALIITQTHASSTGDILQLKNNSSTVFTVSQAGKVKIADGTQGNNKVFKSDASGIGSWGTLSTLETDPIFAASAAFGITGTDITHWNLAYDKFPIAVKFTGTSTKTLEITLNDGSTLTDDFIDLTGIGTVTSVNGDPGPTVLLGLSEILDQNDTAAGRNISIAGGVFTADVLRVSNGLGYYAAVSSASLTANRSIGLPDSSGVILTTISSATVQNKGISGLMNTLTDLDASQLSMGTVNTARLGSGTANSSTVLFGNNTWGTLPATGVTSVGLTGSSIFNITNSPITSSGNIDIDFKPEVQNTVFASPNGSTGVPTFRSLVLADLPSISTSDIVGLVTALAAKEPTITAGTTAQYWRGDKSWQTLNATAVGLGNVPNTNATARSTHTGTQLASTISDFGTTARGLFSETGNELVYTSSTGVFATNKTEQVLTDGPTITWNVANGYNAKVTLGGNRTLSITNAVAGEYYTLKVIQDGTGSRTLSMPAGSKVANAGAGVVTLTTTIGATDLLTFYYDGTNFWINKGANYT